jgi:MFS family permease
MESLADRIISQVPVSSWCGYEIAILVISIALGVSFVVVEGRVKEPLLPLNIWKAPSFGAAMLVVLLTYMAYGTGFWYMAAWQQLIRKWTLLEFAAGSSPLIIFGSIAAFLSAWLIPRLAVEGILAIGALAVVVGNILIATMPAQQTYWAQVFPAVVLFSFCPDFIFTAAQIIASNSVSRENQGRAGSLIGVLQLYGTSIGVGFAGLVEVETDDHGLQPLKGYRGALYLGIGLGIAALLVDLMFVRMPKDTRGLKDT